MKAVVVERPNRVAYTDIDEPAVGRNDVLVRSCEAGLCRTDIEMMTGVFTDPRWVQFPVIPGHEWSGTVVEVGANVESVRAGDRVVCEGMIGCNRCPACRRGQTQWCERIEALGFTRPGGYAELVTVPARVVHVLPDHVSFDAGVLVEPASVVLHGLEKARPRPGESVGVIGVGTLGSLAIALLSLYSPAAIVAYGIREEELALATELGAKPSRARRRGRAADRRTGPGGRDRGRAGRDRARHAAVPAWRTRGAARDRRRGAHVDPRGGPVCRQGHGSDRQHCLSGDGLVARRAAARRVACWSSTGS